MPENTIEPTNNKQAMPRATVQNPVFICGAPRSGTTLLSNLLDWNPKYLVFPGETGILNMYFKLNESTRDLYFQRDFLFFDPDTRLYWDGEYRKKFNGYLETAYGPHVNLEFSSIKGDQFWKGYHQEIKNPTDLANAYLTTYEALRASITNNVHQDSITSFIEKRPLDNEMSAVLLKRTFPGAKFIHILRDPRTRYISSKGRHIGRLGFVQSVSEEDFPTTTALISAVSFYCAKMNKSIFGDDYLILRYEDLLSNREKEMRRIADFLGMEFDPILLEQTTLGRPVASVSSFKENIKSSEEIEAKRLKKYESGTSSLEKDIISFYCAELAQGFGYSLNPPAKKLGGNPFLFLRPAKNENPARYLKNRLSYWKELRSFLDVHRRVQGVITDFFNGISRLD